MMNRKIDVGEKFSHTSLFAEMIKDKHKREIFEKNTDPVQPASHENSISNDAVGQQPPAVGETPKSNGIRDMSINDNAMNLTDIPMPSGGGNEESNTIGGDGGPDMVDGDGTKMTTFPPFNSNSSNEFVPALVPPPPLPAGMSDPALDGADFSKLTTLPVITNNNIKVNDNNNTITNNTSASNKLKHSFTINKPKSLTKLPMPPGVNMSELEDVTTPSPPRPMSPVGGSGKNVKPQPIPTLTTTAAGTVAAVVTTNSQRNGNSNSNTPKSTSASSSSKKSLLNLPMPPSLPGTEDVSGDEDIGSPIQDENSPSSFSAKFNSTKSSHSRSSSASRKPKGPRKFKFLD